MADYIAHQVQKCKDDGCNLAYRSLSLNMENSDIPYVIPTKYCPSCESYETVDGMASDPMQAAKSFFIISNESELSDLVIDANVL